MDKIVLTSSKELEQLEEIGIVVGESSPSSFVFAVHPSLNDKVPRWEFVIAPLAEGFILAQIRGVISYSSLLKKELEYQALTRLTSRFIEECKHWREARVLAYIEDLNSASSTTCKRVKYAVTPGTKVYLAPDDLLTRVYSGSGKTLYVGHLVTRHTVKVNLSVSGFRRHVAIIAQTGAGKSYLTGVIMEELLEKGATILVLDPHADYVRMTKANDVWSPNLARRVTVYRASTRKASRYIDVENLEVFSIRFANLSLEDIFYVCNVEERHVWVRDVIRRVYDNLRKTRRDNYTLQDMVRELTILSQNEEARIREAAQSALRRISNLAEWNVFGKEETEISEMLKPMHISVIDLSGLSDREADLIAYIILSKILNFKTQYEGQGFKLPIFLFIEEAHRFAPPNESTWSLPFIKRIAAEGRKFGIFLTLISQRPSKIHPDILSQCNSQIIMRITNPKDQKAVLEASERLGEELLEDLPGLDKGEAVVVGDIINMPAIISVRKRRSYEGGADIDVDGLLDEALKMAAEEEREKGQINEDWRKFRERSEPK
ncbi:MAG: ATP-binding protein [Candidatus Bathyarchaeia archaeon]